MTTGQLIALLRRHAAGLLAGTAAIDLLAGHGTWPARPEFRRHISTGHSLITGEPIAWIDWQGAANALATGLLQCSTSEADILTIAAALGDDIPLHLRHVLGGLDHRNIALVTDAITAANGTRPHIP